MPGIPSAPVIGLQSYKNMRYHNLHQASETTQTKSVCHEAPDLPTAWHSPSLLVREP